MPATSPPRCPHQAMPGPHCSVIASACTTTSMMMASQIGIGMMKKTMRHVWLGDHGESEHAGNRAAGADHRNARAARNFAHMDRRHGLQQAAGDTCDQENDQELHYTHPVLDNRAEGQQHDHVEEEMRPVAVKKQAGDNCQPRIGRIGAAITRKFPQKSVGG